MNKKNKVLIVLAAIGTLFVVWSIYYLSIPITPNTDMYKVTRTCDFVTVGDITGVFCTDGSTWQTSPLVVEVVSN